jgi:hypothetical protein
MSGLSMMLLGLSLGMPGAELAQDSNAKGEVEQLRSTVADLQKQVDELKAANNQDWLTEQRAAEIRGLVQEVMADADTRASLLQSGAVAGRDGGFFFIGSSDGNFLLRIAGQVQVRFVYNMQDESPTDDTRYGFEIRRAKFDFRGHIVDPSWQYYIEAEANRNGGGISLAENGWIQKDFGDGFKARFGQFKPMFLREESVSSRRLQSVERSLINSQFTAGTAQGVQLEKSADQWRVFGAFIDGIRTLNTAWSMEDTEYAFTGRGEFLANGEWKDIDDDIGFRDGGNALMFGAGANYERGEFGTASDEVENLGLTADATFKNSGGFSAVGAVIFRQLEGNAAAIDLDQIGIMIRGGFFVSDDVELFAMYEWGDLDVDTVEELSVVTLGVNKYFAKHTLKWQNDLGFALDEVDAAWATDSAGWRADGVDQDGQIVFRSQFQLLF